MISGGSVSTCIRDLSYADVDLGLADIGYTQAPQFSTIAPRPIAKYKGKPEAGEAIAGVSTRPEPEKKEVRMELASHPAFAPRASTPSEYPATSPEPENVVQTDEDNNQPIALRVTAAERRSSSRLKTQRKKGKGANMGGYETDIGLADAENDDDDEMEEEQEEDEEQEADVVRKRRAAKRQEAELRLIKAKGGLHGKGKLALCIIGFF